MGAPPLTWAMGGGALSTCVCTQLYARRQLASLGSVFKSTSPVRLTEEDTEYNIFCIKHIFEEHVVFQFDCTNTISEQVWRVAAIATAVEH
eukprot:scaffold427_cov19-Tisochrysis_lutea.AAC.1